MGTWAQIVDGLAAAASALGLKNSFIVGLIGALVSLRFLTEMTTWTQRLSTALGGAFCANYGAPLAVDFFTVQSQGGEASIAFLVGLFGMSVAAAGMKLINEGEAWALIKSKLGGKA